MILFYKSKDEYGWLSNLYPVPVMVSNPDGFGCKLYKTSEHAYQVAKCKRLDERNAIEMVPRGVHAAILGHGLFDYMIVDNWEEIKIERMDECLRAKFTQHSDLKEKLLATGNEKLAEDSLTDSFWGIGPWKHDHEEESLGWEWIREGSSYRNGKNILGELLMDLRSEFRKERASRRLDSRCL